MVEAYPVPLVMYIFDADDYEKVGKPSEDELDMLDLSFNLTPTSRLGCQIRISEDLSGLRVHVPDDF